MPATGTKEILSGSPASGRGIKVAAIATPGTTIHTAHATLSDEIWIYAYNADTVARLLTIQWGGVSPTDDDRKVSIPAQSGLILVIPGLPLTGSLIVKAFAAVTNVIILDGFVNRVTNS